MQINGLDNTLDKIDITNKDIEKLICSYTLSFDNTRRDDIEWKMRFPMFVPSFYKFVINNNSIPTQAEFWHVYISDNLSYLKSLNLSMEQKQGLRARVYRTYPSLVRDLHFGKSLKSTNDFNDIFYNEIIDVEYGVDLVVYKCDILIGLNLYTNTKIAKQARQVKQYRPKRSLNFKCIELPIDFRGSKKCGNFFLYSEKEIEQIKKTILNHI